MSSRDQVMQIVDALPEYKVDGLLGFLRIFAASQEDIPNSVTAAALREGDEMLRTGKGQHFQGTAKEFFAMLDAEDGDDAQP